MVVHILQMKKLSSANLNAFSNLFTFILNSLSWRIKIKTEVYLFVKMYTFQYAMSPSESVTVVVRFIACPGSASHKPHVLGNLVYYSSLGFFLSVKWQ